MARHKNGLTLTEKEKMFCEEYMVDLDATKAAIRAGYSEDSAKSIGYHNRQKPAVNAYISQLKEERRLELRITAKQVLLELAKIGFADIEDFMKSEDFEEADGSAGPKDPAPLLGEGQPQETAIPETAEQAEEAGDNVVSMKAQKCTAALMHRVVRVDAATGERTITYFDLRAKIAALKLLGRHLGLFEKGKAQERKLKVIFPYEDGEEEELFNSQAA